MVAKTIPVSDFDLIIFGGTGDLATRKILPALFRRLVAGQMPSSARIIGAARGDLDTTAFRAHVKAGIEEYLPKDQRPAKEVKRFLECLDFVPMDVFKDEGYKDLLKLLRKDVVRAFYLSVGPSLFSQIAESLKKHKLSDAKTRIVVEKPFGHDLATAQDLNKTLTKSFNEDQIYRIDHYLGKETVQNLMAIRFGNALFEPLWNAQNIDHVQITVAENIGVGGRGSYYDKSGAMRDMVQNHLMQLLCLTAMEPPARFVADAVRDEKLKVIRALQAVSNEDVVRGQYASGGDTEAHPSYLEQVENVNSTTESFVAMKVEIGNWRWSGTPFYLRTGKRLRHRMSEIAITFKHPPHSIFDRDDGLGANVLAIRLQPDEGITLSMTIKDPGPGGMRLRTVPLDMSFAEALGEDVEGMPDAYERLIMDVIRGNQTLFMRGDEVEAAWAWVDPIIDGWTQAGIWPRRYDSFGSGPDDAQGLLYKDGRKWREISE